ncbi:MAG: hypothetical protein BWY06_00917 [Candidatus Latescibacteria bacterium ADurb.Bin168]|nr:MAG: hypothetical protein BWY06_00917 [Candidatus Latescibacteria bacterium ADurb.Bin168]
MAVVVSTHRTPSVRHWTPGRQLRRRTQTAPAKRNRPPSGAAVAPRCIEEPVHGACAGISIHRTPSVRHSMTRATGGGVLSGARRTGGQSRSGSRRTGVGWRLRGDPTTGTRRVLAALTGVWCVQWTRQSGSLHRLPLFGAGAGLFHAPADAFHHLALGARGCVAGERAAPEVNLIVAVFVFLTASAPAEVVTADLRALFGGGEPLAEPERYAGEQTGHGSAFFRVRDSGGV